MYKSVIPCASVVAIIVLTLSGHFYSATAQTFSGKLVFSWFGDIYSMDIDDPEPTRLTTDKRTREAVWSPDGNKIAFVGFLESGFEIFVMEADGSNITQLTNNTANDSQIAWSPDGAKLAFVSDRDGNREVYVMNAVGTNQTNLTNYVGWDDQPAWSPDSSQLTFVTDRDTDDWQLYLINVDGSGLNQITQNTAINKLPAWSPDGTKIAFSRSEGNSCEQIYTINPDGTNETNISGDICDLGLIKWLPDTSNILYMHNAILYELKLDGTEQEVKILPTFGSYPTGFDYLAHPISVSPPGTGLRGQYHDALNFGTLKFFRIVPTIDFNWGTGSTGAVDAGTTVRLWLPLLDETRP